MTTKVKTVLNRWEKSINRYQNLDKWSIVEDYNIISSFIRETKNKSAKSAVARCRDIVIKGNGNYDGLGKALSSALKILENLSEPIMFKSEDYKNIGQRERYHDVSKSIGKEKIKCCESKYLRNLDITILEPRESRMIRRIVEKRMCQEYHKQHKESFHSNGNKSRHQMKRAVSYQLYNIGQMEGEDIHRDSSTHWKWKYDRNLKEWVLKKKVAYKTIEEAEIAAQDYMSRNPQAGKISVYKCAFCNMYHIGHTRECDLIAG